MCTNQSAVRLLALLLAVAVHQAHSFATPSTNLGSSNHRLGAYPNPRSKQSKFPPIIPRGGETELNMAAQATIPILERLLFPALRSGPYGVVALTAVAAAAVVPLTLYKQVYSISVGYGAAVFLIGLALQLAFQPSALVGRAFTGALMFYGLRLASYLLLRDQTRKSPSQGGMKDSPILQRLPLALSVSLFYAFLTVPALFSLQSLGALVKSSSTELLITQSGIGLAVFGAVLEAVADLQKYWVKQSANNSKADQFYGPTSFTYRLCRHPNYLGEILFWAGVSVAGVPSFGNSMVAWLSSVMGLYGIVSIMSKATSRLEGWQEEKYSGQEKYDTWVKKVKAPLFPFL